MGPFVVISFGKKLFRTRIIRHSRNPVWDEKLLFHVRRYEMSYEVQFTILDWDKLSSNDHIGDVNFDVKDLDSAAQSDSQMDLYLAMGSVGTLNSEGGREGCTRLLSAAANREGDASGGETLTRHKVSVRLSPIVCSTKFTYSIHSAKYLTMLSASAFGVKQYHNDDAGAFSHLEIISMLDSLGYVDAKHNIVLLHTVRQAVIRRRNHHRSGGAMSQDRARPTEQRQGACGRGLHNMPDTVTAAPVVMITSEHGEEVKRFGAAPFFGAVTCCGHGWRC